METSRGFRLGYLLAIGCCLCSLTAGIKTTTTISPLMCPDDCQCVDDYRRLICSDLDPLTVDSRLSDVTKEIRLKRDFIGPIVNSTFRKFVALETIDLSFSKVTYVQKGVFIGLSSLKTLNLQGNFLRMLDEFLFKDNVNLETLDISQNSFIILQDEPFRFLPNLKHLNVSYNMMSSARLGVRFQVPSRLETIDFSGNHIQEVFEEDFLPARRWHTTVGKSFNFSHCQMRSISLQAVKDLRNVSFLGLSHNVELEVNNVTEFLSVMGEVLLKVIDISYTNLTAKGSMSDLTVDTLGTLSVTGLNLAGNYLEEIDDNVLTFMSIQWLDLSDNQLTALSPGIGKLHGLKYLDISNNMLATVCDEFKDNVDNLEVLKLAGNQLTDQSNLNLDKAVKLRRLDLSDNQLEVISIPRELVNLESLYLSRNKIRSLNEGGPLIGLTNLMHISLSGNKLTKLDDFWFRDSRNVDTAMFDGNMISEISHQTFVPNCPKHVDLSRNALVSVHHYGWHDLLSISLSGNKINDVQTQAFYFLEELRSLDLSHNELATLSLDVFTHLRNLSTLKLNDNFLDENLKLSQLLAPVESLQYFDISSNNFTSFDYIPVPFNHNYNLREIRLSHNYIPTISPWVFSGLDHLEYVDFSHNPFHCACESVAIQKWCKTTSVVVGNQENYGYLCRTPKLRGSRTLLDFSVNTFECNGYLLHIVIFSSVGGAVMLLAVMIGSACYCWKQWQYRTGKITKPNKPDLDLVGYKKLKRDISRDEEFDDDIIKFRQDYLRQNASDTLIDVEFEYPKVAKVNMANGVGHRDKVKKSKEKDKKLKLKKKPVSKKKDKKALLNGVIRDGRNLRFENGYCNHSRSSLRKILSVMDKEYRKKSEKKKSKSDDEEKRGKKRKSRGNRDLVRLVSLRGSRSMPDVLSYIESLPRHGYGRSQGNRYTTVPIHHVDHVDGSDGHWATSLVELPRVHRSSTVSGPLDRYRQYVDVPRIHRSSSGAVHRVTPVMDAPRSHRVRQPDPRRLYGTYDPRRVKREAAGRTRLPDGYHTIASTRGRTLVDSRSPWPEPKTVIKTKSASNQENLSQWL